MQRRGDEKQFLHPILDIKHFHLWQFAFQYLCGFQDPTLPMHPSALPCPTLEIAYKDRPLVALYTCAVTTSPVTTRPKQSVKHPVQNSIRLHPRTQSRPKLPELLPVESSL